MNGKTFKVGLMHDKRGLGICTGRRSKNPMILFSTAYPGTEETVLHELIHAYFDQRVSEDDVERLACELVKARNKIEKAVKKRFGEPKRKAT